MRLPKPRAANLTVILSRVISGLLLLTVVGALPWLSQRDPAMSILRARYAEREATPEALDAVRTELGLDGGPIVVALRWWSGVLRGDLGDSWVSGLPVGPGVAQAVGVSATLTGFAFAVAVIVMLLLITPALLAIARDRQVRGSGPVGVALTAMPEFLLAAGFLVLFAVYFQLFPPYGWSGLEYAVLPAAALGIPAGGLLGRLLSDAIAGALIESWVRVWRLAGAGPRQILPAVLRRAIAAVSDQAALVIIGMLGGAVAVEQVYAIPGIGRYLLGAANSQDLPALQAGVLIMALAALVIGIIGSAVRLWVMGGPLPHGAVSSPPERAGSDRIATVTFWVSTALIVLIVVFGLPRDPYTVQYDRLAAPSFGLPFGADASGRDLLARVAHGTVSTMLPAFVIVFIAVAVGLVLGFFPNATRGPVEIANATPPIIAGVIVAALAGPTVGGAALAVLWVSWPPLTAHAAALVEEARSMPHIRWLPLSGVGRAEAAIRHIAPAVIPPLLRHGMLRLPGVALALASLGFLGLGAQPPSPEWGLLLSEGIDYVEKASWATVAPAGALILISIIAVSAASLRVPAGFSMRWTRGWRGTGPGGSAQRRAESTAATASAQSG